MKVSGRDVADKLLAKLKDEISKEKLSPYLAIILAGDDPSSRIYVNNKIKAAERIGARAELFEFGPNQAKACFDKIRSLNADPAVHGIIVQYPVYPEWNFDEYALAIDPSKDVDGFEEGSPFTEATALAVWEMLSEFAQIEGFERTEIFLVGKKIVVIGRGRTAGAPTAKLLEKKGFGVEVVHSDTPDPNQIIKSADVVIGATGVKYLLNKSNLKSGCYVIGVGMSKEEVDGKSKIVGDVHEEEVAQVAKLYSATLGGIGPLTIASLLKNVVESSRVIR